VGRVRDLGVNLVVVVIVRSVVIIARLVVVSIVLG